MTSGPAASDKERILSRIRAVRPRPEDVPVDIPRSYAREPARAGAPDVLDLFADRLDHVGAHLHRATTGQVAETVATALGNAGVSALITPPGLPADWLPSSGFRWIPDEPRLSTDAIDAADGVLTAVRVVAADSGTIILDGGPGQGRRVLSLVPDYQCCVVQAEQVVSGLPAALAALDPRRPTTFVTGPSATVDIELVRVSGVHGPRRLDVVLVEEQRDERGPG